VRRSRFSNADIQSEDTFYTYIAVIQSEDMWHNVDIQSEDAWYIAVIQSEDTWHNVDNQSEDT
jgi:hydroxylamine reductase (hybrid-cluster protein)